MISWASNKPNSIALFTDEVEYVFATSCCSQLLWVKYQLEDYPSFENNIPIYCDNTSLINRSKNPIQHSKAKHTEIRYHFIHDYMQKGVFDIKCVDTDHQCVDIFTKTLSKKCFICMRKCLNVTSLSDQ